MRTIIFLLLLLGVGNLPQLAACEACGCSIMFWEMGLTPRFQSHQLSMGWNHQRFTSYSSLEAKALGQIGSEEYFQQLDLQLQLRLHDRWRLSVALPYAFLQREIAGETWSLDGWSDPSVLLQYVVLDQENKKRTEWRHRLSAGVGAKLPWGQQAKLPEQDNTQVNFRLGTGSLDGMAYLQYVLRRGDWGLSADVLASRNGENEEDYRYGHRWSGHLTVFNVIARGKLGIMPSLGLYRETAAEDVQRGYYRSHTGGQYTFGQLGLQVFFPAFSTTLRYQHPLEQKWAEGLTEAGGRMTVQFTYFFGGKPLGS